MKETDDMCLFVFSSSALYQVNTAMQSTAKVGGTKKKTQDNKRAGLWDESFTHHTQVFARHCSEQTPEVKANNGAASKTFGWHLMPRKTD